jgi:hypothetical protein
MNIEQVPAHFVSECKTPEGRELCALIERHSDEMVRFSETGKPALAAVLPHVPLRLAEALKLNDRLMQAFGAMAHAEMRERGSSEKGGSASYDWPKIRSESHLTTFHRTSS